MSLIPINSVITKNIIEVIMIELSLAFMNKLASQTLFISGLLGGFSLTVLVLLVDSTRSSKLYANMFRAAAVATGSFLVSIFDMTKIKMMTTEDYPFEVVSSDLLIPRIIGVLTFLLGIICVVVIKCISGWTKSKGLGIFTTCIGLVTLVLILFMIF